METQCTFRDIRTQILVRLQQTLQKMCLLSSPCLSVCQPVCSNTTTQRSFMKFYIGEF